MHEAAERLGGRKSSGLTATEIARVTAHVRERLHGPITVAELAALVGRSGSCFARVFKEATGLTPHRFVVRARVTRAREMIDSREGGALATIAVRCGFSDQAHLTRAFRREFGVTPAAHCRGLGESVRLAAR